MKVINNETIDLEIITNKTSPVNWGNPSCYSCNKPFQINTKKIKWRMKIPGANYTVWKTQCNICAVNTILQWTNQLNDILQRNVIEVNAVGN